MVMVVGELKVTDTPEDVAVTVPLTEADPKDEPPAAGTVWFTVRTKLAEKVPVPLPLTWKSPKLPKVGVFTVPATIGAKEIVIPPLLIDVRLPLKSPVVE